MEFSSKPSITENDIDNAVRFARSVHGGDSGGHDAEHIRRVMNNAADIIDNSGMTDIDIGLVMICCALHDVDDKKLRAPGVGKHENIERFCSSFGLTHIEQIIAEIIDSVSYSDNPEINRNITPEAAVVQDADRLDALGAVGIARAFAYGGKTGRAMYGDGSSTVAHFYDKLFRLPSLMNTEYAKKLAISRVDYMKIFLENLCSECGMSL